MSAVRRDLEEVLNVKLLCSPKPTARDAIGLPDRFLEVKLQGRGSGKPRLRRIFALSEPFPLRPAFQGRVKCGIPTPFKSGTSPLLVGFRSR